MNQIYQITIYLTSRIIQYVRNFKNKNRFSFNKKRKDIYRPKIQANKKLDLILSSLLSVMTSLICVSIPYKALEEPHGAFKYYGLDTLYDITTTLERYLPLIDRAIVALFILLIYIELSMVFDAIRKTDINISLWIETGKCVPPGRIYIKKQSFIYDIFCSWLSI